MKTKQSTRSTPSPFTDSERESPLATGRRLRDTSDTVTRILAQTSSIALAGPRLLQTVGEGLGWHAGRLWTKGGDGPRGDRLTCSATWFEPSITDTELKAISFQLNLPSAAELRYHVSCQGEPTYGSPLGHGAPLGRNLKQNGAKRSQYRLLVCPIQARNLNFGVIEFIRRASVKAQSPVKHSESDLLTTATNLAYQVGQFMELQLAEAYLQRTEERFQALLDNSQAAIYIKDTFGRYVLFNQWHENLLGFQKDETLGKTDYELLPRDIADNIASHDAAVLAGGTTMMWEEMFPHRDGLHTYLSTKFPLRDRNGAITAIGGISTDITQRKQAEDALRTYAEQLDKLCDLDTAVLAARLPESIAEAVLAHIGQVVPSSHAAISLFEPGSPEIQTFSVAHDPRPPTNGNSPIVTREVHTSLAKLWDLPDPRRGKPDTQNPGPWSLETLREGKLTDIEDIMVLAEEGLPPPLRKLQAEGVRALVTLPLISHQALLGTLTVCSRVPSAFANSPSLFRIVQLIASKTTIAIQNALLFQQVRSGHEMLQAMSTKLINAQESERRHTARELHDEIGQALTAVKMNLQFVSRSAQVVDGQGAIQDSIQIVEQALEQVRSLALDLRPSMLDDLGLTSALRWYVDRFRIRSGIHVKLSAGGAPAKPRLPAEIEIACFRVAQEALTNVIRHAQAQHVEVILHRKRSQLLLQIEDDGVGFDFQAARKRSISGASLGLLSMQERVEQLGGTLSIQSSPNKGTILSASFTIAPPDAPLPGKISN